MLEEELVELLVIATAVAWAGPLVLEKASRTALAKEQPKALVQAKELEQGSEVEWAFHSERV
jgi:hypothetical protein